jgi:hypothetical protein
MFPLLQENKRHEHLSQHLLPSGYQERPSTQRLLFLESVPLQRYSGRFSDLSIHSQPSRNTLSCSGLRRIYYLWRILSNLPERQCGLTAAGLCRIRTCFPFDPTRVGHRNPNAKVQKKTVSANFSDMFFRFSLPSCFITMRHIFYCLVYGLYLIIVFIQQSSALCTECAAYQKDYPPIIPIP